MDAICFSSHGDLAEYMCEKALEGKTVTAVLFFEDATVLLKELACFEETTLQNIEVHEPIWNGYNKEFYVTIDSDLCVWSEEAYHENKETGFKGYYGFGGEDVVALIDGHANSQVIKAAAESGYIAEIEVDKDACYDCEECWFSDEQAEDLKDIIEFIFEHIFEE